MDKKPIRVAQIIGNANAGGVESVIMNLYKNIDRTRVQFDFFVEQTCPIINREIIESMGGKIVIIPPYKKLPTYEKELVRLFKEGNYKIVHSNMNTISVFTLAAAKKAGVKVRIAHSHSTASPKELVRSALKYALRPFSKVNANYYFACSKKAGIWQFGNKTYNEGKITLINNAIDVDKFKFNEISRREIREKYNIPMSSLVIGHVGRFVTVKNHAYLLKIFKALKDKHPDSKLLIVGGGPLEEEIKNTASELGIYQDVVLAGVTNNPAPYYSAMDAFLLPSLYEGFPVVGVEAQASGLLTVFSNNVTEEAKLINHTKFLPIDEESINDWVNEIIKYHNSNVSREIEENSLLNTQYNIKNSASTLVNIYEKLLKEEYGE